MALLLKGSGVEKGSILVVFLKKSSEEALNGSASLKGSPPKGSATLTKDNRIVLADLSPDKCPHAGGLISTGLNQM